MAHTKTYFFYEKDTEVCNIRATMCAMKVKNNTYHVGENEGA